MTKDDLLGEAWSAAGVGEHVVETGADDFLAKLVHKAELARHVKSLLRLRLCSRSFAGNGLHSYLLARVDIPR